MINNFELALKLRVFSQLIDMDDTPDEIVRKFGLATKADHPADLLEEEAKKESTLWVSNHLGK